MSLTIAALNSGSNGNCYYIANEVEAILIDAGLTCKELEVRMQRLQLSMAKVKAIFISHEHADHLNGLGSVTKKHCIPVYITRKTLRNAKMRIDGSLLNSFETNDTISVGALQIKAFAKVHDADDPHSFTVSCNDVTIGVLTDIGYACEEVINHFSRCNAAFLESNYDRDMLAESRYPYFLKHRISGGKGHLSNMEALHLFRNHRSSFLSHLILSHLSANNNCPQLVARLFNEHRGSTHITVASRYKETQLFNIKSSAPGPLTFINRKIRQLSLFD